MKKEEIWRHKKTKELVRISIMLTEFYPEDNEWVDLVIFVYIEGGHIGVLRREEFLMEYKKAEKDEKT